MHLAVCDDNIADRKQTERLLGREADRWIAEGGTLYIESYGNAATLVQTPMQYDAFLIDICHTIGTSGLSLVEKLREKGVIAPIIMMCSEVDYRKQSFPENTRYIDKPIQPSALHDVLMEVREELSKIVPHIELRGEFDTMYVLEDEILYAQERGYFTHVTLTEGREIDIRCSACLFFEEITGGHPLFVMPTLKEIINIKHIDHIRFRYAYMDDGNKFSVHGAVLDYIRERMNAGD